MTLSPGKCLARPAVLPPQLAIAVYSGHNASQAEPAWLEPMVVRQGVPGEAPGAAPGGTGRAKKSKNITLTSTPVAMAKAKYNREPTRGAEAPAFWLEQLPVPESLGKAPCLETLLLGHNCISDDITTTTSLSPPPPPPPSPITTTITTTMDHHHHHNQATKMVRQVVPEAPGAAPGGTGRAKKSKKGKGKKKGYHHHHHPHPSPPPSSP